MVERVRSHGREVKSHSEGGPKSWGEAIGQGEEGQKSFWRRSKVMVERKYQTW